VDESPALSELARIRKQLADEPYVTPPPSLRTKAEGPLVQYRKDGSEWRSFGGKRSYSWPSGTGRRLKHGARSRFLDQRATEIAEALVPKLAESAEALQALHARQQAEARFRTARAQGAKPQSSSPRRRRPPPSSQPSSS
jgi:hypothetical protein